MTTALEGGEGSASRPGHCLPPERTWYPLYRRLGGPQGRSGQVRKISSTPGLDPRTVQPVASRYTDWATRPTVVWIWTLYCDDRKDIREYFMYYTKMILRTKELITPKSRIKLFIARSKRDGTCAETRFGLSAKRTSPFKSAGVSVQSIAGSGGVRISGQQLYRPCSDIQW